MGFICNSFNEQFSSVKGIVGAVVDILVVAVLLFFLFVFLRKQHCSRLIIVVIIALLAAALLSSDLLELTVLGNILSVGVLLAVVGVSLLFSQELRRSLWKLSSAKSAKDVFTTRYDCSDDELRSTIDSIVRATLNMAKKDIGALIIIAPSDVPQNILSSGTRMDSLLSSALLECIFNTKAPLHDGAVFIHGNKIIASGCFLPLSQNINVDKELGTRHRAALGVTETTNVLAIIVSEESGIISTAFNGELTRYYDAQMLHDRLEQVYGLKVIDDAKARKLRKRR